MDLYLFGILFLLAVRACAMPAAVTDSTAFNAASPRERLERLAQFALDTTLRGLGHNSTTFHGKKCTRRNLRIRRDWRAFSRSQKKAYIRSILCLQALPPRTPSHLAAGAKTRYDDFVATHINQTWHIHRTGTFLAWHRYFIYEFEQTLRHECGYTGDLPYWNWPADINSMERSPFFDGSDTSLSGNGEYIPDQPDLEIPMGETDIPPLILPPGTGGGCVTSGPFVNYTVNMGPSFLYVPGGNVSRMSNPLDYNPRCMKRDLTTSILRDNTNYARLVDLLLTNGDVWDFETNVQGAPGSGQLGVHGGGHLAIGGDPGRDADANPGDPGFWPHHGMIDRLWWIWQSMDPAARQDAISGTDTFLNNPASPNTTLDTRVNVGYVKPGSIAMRELMSTTAGPFCYVYL
ncbi:Tyrosinase-like protein orsC [Penicillium macrosclerotiorum]|uniref:Tyrosinase-like protein orsC n=1 Tax=Penicillium macrosclerotiorum TaxID=303699 RepID=UPI00254799F1|nr:Tyrosinase-like protein orsC [Penicillium macrosclerotiorum]KAJ5675420.1 Tyrosinase-like protein orsC [Penicillium macrosclerotiorum]